MGSGVRRSWVNLVAGIALAGLVVPAVAQDIVSPGYSFIKAVRDRDGDKVQKALDRPGSTVILSRDDANGETALHIVTKRRDIVWMRFMLAKGVSINARDRQGNTALFDAAQLGFVEGEQQLIDLGASIDLANNRGETPLIIATQAHDIASVRLLITNGANPRETDHVAGMSALDYAKRDGRSDQILKVLEEAKPVVKKNVAGPSIN